MYLLPISVAVRSKAFVCSRLSAGIAGSIPAEDKNIRLLCLLCIIQVAASAKGWSFLQRIPATGMCVI